MTTAPGRQPWGGCRACKHLRDSLRCAAFPEQIPLAIFSGELDHLVPRPGQVGEVVFEIAWRPTGLAHTRLRMGLAKGEQWAIDALAHIDPAVADELRAAVTAPTPVP